jgi:predicted alpha/beta-hydrolase family hydrolase
MAAALVSPTRRDSELSPPIALYATPDALLEVETPSGLARVRFNPARHPIATLVLGHGAGRGVDAPDLAGLARDLPARGVTVCLVEQPWRVAGRRVADRPGTLDAAWLAVVAELERRGLIADALVCGGRSAGARVAVRTARAIGADAVLALAFPLHPSGRATMTRLPELTQAALDCPVLVVQGTRDPFGGPDELAAQLPTSLVRRPVGPLVRNGVVIHSVPWADHSLAVGRRAPLTSRESWQGIVSIVGWWVSGVARLDRQECTAG